ncbi:hypothetical protein [Tellurirhabdus rosea]|uniref:hypothetical protein n=1 Tax=Tellurirhabdus rosea TaxID=2674997 RepID=UPI002259BC8A|nr:hypothetical protein [Tellurirhabdus rosea]
MAPIVRLNLKWIGFILGVLIFINISLLFTTWFSQLYSAELYQSNQFLFLLLQQTDLSLENVLAAWYSSMLLLSVSLVSILCFFSHRPASALWLKNKSGFGWLFFSLSFGALSFSELGSLHETIGDIVLFSSSGGKYGWYVFYFLIGCIGLFMLLFTWIHLRQSTSGLFFATLSVLFFISVPVQEVFEFEFWKAGERPVSYLLLEEGSELFGSLSMLVATMIYFIQSAEKQPQTLPASRVEVRLSVNTGRVFTYIGLVLLAMGFLMLSFSFTTRSHSLSDDQSGIAKNWFPSVVAFVSFVYGAYQVSRKKNTVLYGLMSFLCLFLSVYYGSNWYVFPFLHSGSIKSLLLLSIIGGISVYLSYVFYRNQTNSLQRIPILFFLFSLLISLLTWQTYAAEFGFLSFSSLLVSQLSYNHFTKKSAINTKKLKPKFT